jgi:hypothetical protein
MASSIMNIASMVESQSLNAIVAGFSFASAVAWMDVVRWVISQVINVNKHGGNYYLLTALFTTVLAVVVYIVTKAVAFNIEVQAPSQPVYAVTRA